MKKSSFIIQCAFIVLMLLFLSAIHSEMRKTNETLETMRAIASEERDTLNVQNCYLLNDNEDSFNNCLND